MDREVLQVASTQTTLAVEKEAAALSLNIGKIRASCSANGSFQSSRLILEVQRACAESLEQRIRRAWEILHRCVTAVGIEYEDGLAQQLKQEISKHFPAETSEFESVLVKACMPGAHVPNIGGQIFDARTAGLSYIHSEIDLFVLSLKKKPLSPNYHPSVTINNSTIASLQTGPQSIAHFTQDIRASTADLDAALQAIVAALENISELPKIPKREVLELVVESRAELAKERPSTPKIRAYIGDIATGISTLGSLKPAYETLQAAAKAMGFEI